VRSYYGSNNMDDLDFPLFLPLPAGGRQSPVCLPDKVKRWELRQIEPSVLPQWGHAFSSILCKTPTSYLCHINGYIMLHLLTTKIVIANIGQPKKPLHLRRNTEQSCNWITIEASTNAKRILPVTYFLNKSVGAECLGKKQLHYPIDQIATHHLIHLVKYYNYSIWIQP